MDPSSSGARPALMPGDVLLFHGHGFVSWAIRRFDESDVDRAAIVLRPETMAEVTVSGLRHLAIEPAVQGNAFTYVRRLTGAVDPMSVAAQALSFVSERPVTDDRIVMLAMLGMTRKLPLDEPTLRRLLCVLLDRASGIADRLRARGRGLSFSSEFVYRCFERTGDPRSDLEVRRRSTSGTSPRPALAAAEADAVLSEWASRFPDPKRVTTRWADDPLEPLIASFARIDSPTDPIVPRSYVADAAIVEPAKAVDDDVLLAASVRFRDAILRLSPDESAPGQRWDPFLRLAPFVTPGDLRYTHSLRLVTSLRPTEREARTWTTRGSDDERADRSS